MIFKPPRWCLVQFPKMAAHLLGREALEENYSKNIWFGDQAGDKLRQRCPFREFNSREARTGRGPWVRRRPAHWEKASHQKLLVLLGGQDRKVPVSTDGSKTAGSNKLGLHVAIIWHNTIRHDISLFFSLFKYKATCQHIMFF